MIQNKTNAAKLIPINWYFITNNHSISLLCPKHENKSITYKSCKQIHYQHNKINRFCILSLRYVFMQKYVIFFISKIPIN